MQKIYTFQLFLFLVLPLFSTPLFAQSNTVGTTYNSVQAQTGYTLFSPIGSFQTYLIDNCGRSINTWTSNYNPGMSCFLLDDGSLIRSARINNANVSIGGLGGRIEQYDWAGNLTWHFNYSTPTYSQHHDFEVLPNGNILLLVVEVKNFNDMVAVARDTNISNETVLWTESIIEIQPTGLNAGTIVWEWHVWDHLVQDLDSTKPNYANPADHPERMNINYIGSSSSRDWLHANSIDYNPSLDQITIGYRTTNEIWIIDHSTTTAEAADSIGGRYGKGGDILYRWGQPATYGATGPQILYGQHDIHWIPDSIPGAGKLICFNNGDITGISSIEVFTPPTDSAGFYTSPATGMPYGPALVDWHYQDTLDPIFFSGRLSGVQRLPNGNTLICSGANGYFVEVDSNKNRTWTYRNPASSTGIASQGTIASLGTNSVFQCTRYSPDFIGFVGKDMTPGDPIELNFNLNQCIISNITASTPDNELLIYPNPSNHILRVESATVIRNLQIIDMRGQVISLNISGKSFLEEIDCTQFPSGVYTILVNNIDLKQIQIIH